MSPTIAGAGLEVTEQDVLRVLEPFSTEHSDVHIDEIMPGTSKPHRDIQPKFRLLSC